MIATVKNMASIVSLCGTVSFILGIVAEHKKPAAGTSVPGGDGVTVTCKYPADLSVILGYLSLTFLVASTMVGYVSLFYPYKGKPVPQHAMLKQCSFMSFFNISLFTSGLAATVLLWPIITEQLHLKNVVHHNLSYECPTAKTGLLGGGAFLSLDSSLLWLVTLILANNAREDFLEEENGDRGEFGKATSEVDVGEVSLTNSS